VLFAAGIVLLGAAGVFLWLPARAAAPSSPADAPLEPAVG
jgi:hypothetical protein